MNDEQRAFVEVFVTPETTGAAFRFGRVSAFCSHPRMSYEQFMRTSDHPYPSSLYSAYRKGRQRGVEERRGRDERKQANLNGGDPAATITQEERCVRK